LVWMRALAPDSCKRGWVGAARVLGKTLRRWSRPQPGTGSACRSSRQNGRLISDSARD
jgi:hypothetical protein